MHMMQKENWKRVRLDKISIGMLTFNLLSGLELIEWIQKRHPALVEAGRRIFNVVLHNNIRTARYQNEDEFANKMISNIVDELTVDKSTDDTTSRASIEIPAPKRPRGRPRKQEVTQSSVEDYVKPGPRTRQRRVEAANLLTAPAFTTSPDKPTQMKVILMFLFNSSPF